MLECAVNDARAPVQWFKGDEPVDEGKFDGRLVVEKDLLGNCRLTILGGDRRADAGAYRCAIRGTKHVTKTVVSYKGGME